MSYDSWKTDPDYGKVVVATCAHCHTDFMGSAYDRRRRHCEGEDREPSGAKECDAPGCHVSMCPHCQSEAVCGWCGRRYCSKHAETLVTYDDMKVCRGTCEAEARAADMDPEQAQLQGSTTEQLADRLAALRERYDPKRDGGCFPYGYPYPQLRELHLIQDELRGRGAATT